MNIISETDCNKSIEFNGYIGISNIFIYKRVPGVWALLGKKENVWEWVTIASTADIGEEISEDVLYMMKDVPKRGTKHIYKNYWGEELFEYRIFNEKSIVTDSDYYLARRKILWAHIASVYEEFCFICLVENESDPITRLSNEKYIATHTKAKYWNDLNKKFDNNEDIEFNKIINYINSKYNIKIRSKNKTTNSNL